jgi:hypothetical protein
MENQIQLCHDMTAFWLDREWRTPRQRQLEAQVQRLTEENKRLKAELGELRPLKVFLDLPCNYCGKPMSNNWTRDQVLRAFKGWGHSSCINRR